jgi:CPA2 family monovalent cation:H+ antiporter-2
MLFFVSVGMLLNPAVVWDQIGALSLIAGAIILGKAIILAGIVRAFGYWNIVPLAVGLTLFQVGEFAFVLARVGLSSGAISNDVYTLTLNAAIITMALTPTVSSLVPVVYGRLWPRRTKEMHEAINVPKAGLSDHVVIAGSGRVGRSVADALRHTGLPFVLVESDDRRVQQARVAGLPVIYGDASQTIVLEAAGVRRARAMLVTVPPFPDVRSIVVIGRQLRPDLPIMARADSADAVRALYALGVQEVTSPEFEAAIEMTRQALIYFDVPAHEVLQVASAIRHERYDSHVKRDSSLGATSPVGRIAQQLELAWVGVPAESPFNGRTIAELRIRTTTGASVVAIIRDGALVANPAGDARLQQGDVVAALGTREQIGQFHQASAGVSAAR